MTNSIEVMGAYYVPTRVIVCPGDVKLVVVKEGKTVRGVTYFKEALIWLSDNMADYVVAQGDARVAEILPE